METETETKTQTQRGVEASSSRREIEASQFTPAKEWRREGWRIFRESEKRAEF